jgi:hypothetical protein
VTPHDIGGSVADVATMIPKILLPFNLVKATLNAALVLLLYKPLSKTLKRIGFLISSGTSQGEKKENGRMRSALITGIALAVIAGSLAIIFFVLK